MLQKKTPQIIPVDLSLIINLTITVREQERTLLYENVQYVPHTPVFPSL